MIDLHVHTARCRHGCGTAAEFVAAAEGRGVSTLAFTEHLPLPVSLVARVDGADGYAMPLEELDAYVAEVQALRATSSVEVLLGIEADLVADAVDHSRSSVASHPFDMVLGSIHLIDDWAFDDPARMSRYDGWDVRGLWERYFADLADAARSGVADVIAHIDLVKKFGYVPDGPVDDLYRETARVLAAAGLAVEVNTAGLRKPCQELYPAQALLNELRRAGVPVTVGSDAHAPEDVGAGWAEARSAIEEAGYTSVVVFRQRIAEEVGLDDL